MKGQDEGCMTELGELSLEVRSVELQLDCSV